MRLETGKRQLPDHRFDRSDRGRRHRPCGRPPSGTLRWADALTGARRQRRLEVASAGDRHRLTAYEPDWQISGQRVRLPPSPARAAGRARVQVPGPQPAARKANRNEKSSFDPARWWSREQMTRAARDNAESIACNYYYWKGQTAPIPHSMLMRASGDPGTLSGTPHQLWMQVISLRCTPDIHTKVLLEDPCGKGCPTG
jgi:hypothetical protein